MTLISPLPPTEPRALIAGDGGQGFLRHDTARVFPKAASQRVSRALAAQAAAVVWLTLTLGTPWAGWASESDLRDRPAPETAEELTGPLGRAFEARAKEETMFPRLKEALKDLPPFFRDTSLGLHVRTYYFNSRSTGDTVSEAWAGGGWLAYESGWLADTLQLGTTLYTSQPLYAPDDRDGTQLLKPGQEGYDTVGLAYGRLRALDHTLTLGRQEINQPYVNGDHSRMTPNTFEGAGPAVRRGKGGPCISI